MMGRHPSDALGQRETISFTSMFPPDLACIAILRSASAETFTLKAEHGVTRVRHKIYAGH